MIFLGRPVTIHSTGQTFSRFPHIEGIILDAGQVAGGLSTGVWMG